MSATTDTANPTPTVDAVPCGDAYPMPQAGRPALHLSPTVISFVAGVGVTLLIMFAISQMNKKH